MEYLAQHIESLIFTCEHPVSFKEIKLALEEIFEAKIKDEDITEGIETLTERYQSDQSSFEIVKIAGGYQFLTKGAFHATIGAFLKQTIKKRLSTAALETLAIVAYKQPVTKGDIENIRGVNCDYAVQKLLEKELVNIIGRKEAPGRPLLYGVSQKFMDYFGVKDMQDLPKIKEFQDPENSIGEAAPIEENVNGIDRVKRKEDDVVDIAIAIADIYDPLPPREEETQEDAKPREEGTPIADVAALAVAIADIYDPLPATAEEAEADQDTEEAGTPMADASSTNEVEAGASESIDTPENLEAEATEESPTETLDETTTEESTTEEPPVEFVAKTSGEFAGQTSEEILQENKLPPQSENLIAPDDVTSEEETSSLKKD